MSKSQVISAVAPVVGLTAGTAIGKALGKRKIKKMMSKGLINRIRFSLDPGLKREIINKHVGIGSTVGFAAPTAFRQISKLRDFMRGGTIFRGSSKAGKSGGKSGGEYKGFQNNARVDVEDLLKQFGTKRRSEFKTKKEVKEAYRSAARKHHPDLGGDPNAFKRAGNAYERIQETRWFDKLAMLSAMRDEMSKIASAMHAHRAKHAFASGGISTKVLDTKPLDVNQATKSMKISKNAGAPKGFRGPQVPSVAGMKGKRTDPINPSLVTNA